MQKACIKNSIKDKSHMIISIDTEKKALDRIQRLFMVKTLNKLGKGENFLNLIKSIYAKTTANIMLSGKRLKTFSPRTKKEAGMSAFTTSV